MVLDTFFTKTISNVERFSTQKSNLLGVDFSTVHFTRSAVLMY